MIVRTARAITLGPIKTQHQISSLVKFTNLKHKYFEEERMTNHLEGLSQGSLHQNHPNWHPDGQPDHAFDSNHGSENDRLLHDGSPSFGSYLALDQEATDLPISLYKGEKRETATDISLNTPNGALTFTRTYRQSKQATYTFMGLGWTHNHNTVLTKTPGTPNVILVQMGGGA